jgi:hypothetical protein
MAQHPEQAQNSASMVPGKLKAASQKEHKT